MARQVANHRMAAHAPATIRKIRLLREHSGTKRVNGYQLTFRLLRPGLPAPTVTASGFRDLVHPRANRFLTARELARLQTFPDTWTFTGHRLDSFSTKRAVPLPQVAQIGNAVPPALANALAVAVRDQLFCDYSDIVDAEMARHIPAILRRLRTLYPPDRLGNRRNGIDELVFIMLSRRTQDQQYRKGYLALKHAFPTWAAMLRARRSAIEKVLTPLGFAHQRADHVLAALRKINRDFGRLSLARLAKWDTSRALNYLLSLKGVNEKTAKCVLMYAFDREVFPVDTHALRICKRLGLLNPDASEYRATKPLEAIVPPALRADFHIALIQHGRSICLPSNPRCDECPIRRLCEYGRHARKVGRLIK
jgi:endonuclease III